MISALLDEQRFLDHLAFYVNGSLAHDERAWMANYLAQHPQQHSVLAQAHRHYAHSQSLCSHVPETLRLMRLRQKLGWPLTDAPPQLPIPQQPIPPMSSQANGVWARPWLNGLLGALVGGVVVGVVGFQLSLRPQGAEADLSHTRGIHAGCVNSASLRVSLAPQAPWADVAQLLRTLHLQVVSGPTQNGELWLRAEVGTSLPEAVALLGKSPWVEQAVTPSVSKDDLACAP